MVNPYFCYAAAFSITLFMYPFGWSSLYPPLSFSLTSFLFTTIVIHIFAGILFYRKKFASFYKLEPLQLPTAPLIITAVLFCLWVVEFIHAGGIPLLKILFKQPFDYRQFGVPTLHVFVVTFSSFYTVLLFHHWLSSKSRHILLLYIINLSAAILIYNRGMFLFNLSASIFIFLIHKRSISGREVALGASGLLIILYLFGVMGNLRVTNQARKSYSNGDFMGTGRATESFRNSIVPHEFFWTYIYATSPLANVENNIRLNAPDSIGPTSFLQWFNNEVLWDFISKRVNAVSGVARQNVATIPGPFNATTVYAGSFSYLGYAGLVLMACVIIAMPLLYIRMLPPTSPFFLSGLAILNTVFLFMIFDNTLRFTGLSFQLVYPILLNLAIRRFPRVQQIFL